MLGDNTGGGVFMLRPNRLQCVVVWISTVLLCTYVYSRTYVVILNSDLPKIRFAPDLPERDYRVSRGVSVLAK
jgi:hypothetical protein